MQGKHIINGKHVGLQSSNEVHSLLCFKSPMRLERKFEETNYFSYNPELIYRLSEFFCVCSSVRFDSMISYYFFYCF